MNNKIISADAAAALVHDGDVITTSGFVGIGVPDELLSAIETRFLTTGTPQGLTLLFAAGQGDSRNRGLNRLGHDLLLKRVIGGHWGLIPKVAALALANRIEGWNLPQGVISHMFRDIAAGKPGTLTHVGLDTFVDPRLEGGRINPISTEDLVALMEVNGREYLFYRALPIQIALLRGTTADPSGNVTMEREALTIDNLAQAMAAKNSGGLVVVQVERIAAKGSLNPRNVILPSALVDAVVVARPENHLQTYATPYSHLFANQFRAPEGSMAPMPLDPRKIIARRAAFELPINGVINLGIGMPEGVAAVADEEGLLEHLTLTTEPGIIGGQPASGLDFGAAVNTQAIVAQNQQFDFYDGGGLDLAVLGMAETDSVGNVNVSRFGNRLAGAGGFINISQNAGRVVFAGTFTAGGLSVEVKDGGLHILKEGSARKFIAEVGQITFAARNARKKRQPVMYVTERCVFELRDAGLTLTEVAPGVEVQRDILDQMDFAPVVGEVALMDERIFRPEIMNLQVELLHLDLPERITLDTEKMRLFINFEKMSIRNSGDVDAIRARVEALCQPLTDRVDVIANYDSTRIADDVSDEYSATVRALEERFYRTVTRYSSSAWMRMALGERFRGEGPLHIFQTREQSRAFLDAQSERAGKRE